MKTKIVTGFAGSGKSTYLRENFVGNNIIYHDEWAKTFYKSEEAREVIYEYTGHSNISKEQLIESLLCDHNFYEVYSDRGKSSFVEYITEQLKTSKVDAIEIPFLYPFDVLREFGIEVVFIKRDIVSCIKTLEKDRGWSDDRIHMTIPNQIENYINFRSEIDRYITI